MPISLPHYSFLFFNPYPSSLKCQERRKTHITIINTNISLPFPNMNRKYIIKMLQYIPYLTLVISSNHPTKPNGKPFKMYSCFFYDTC